MNSLWNFEECLWNCVENIQGFPQEGTFNETLCEQAELLRPFHDLDTVVGVKLDQDASPV